MKRRSTCEFKSGGPEMGKVDIGSEATGLAEDRVQFFRQTGEIGCLDGGECIGAVGQAVEAAEQAVLQLGNLLLVAGGGEDRQTAPEGIGSVLQPRLRSRGIGNVETAFASTT